MSKSFNVGDRVVYTRDKHTTKPGPRAKNVIATPHGEMYEYQVDKYWLVIGVQADGQLIFKTRRGKLHSFPADDPRLRKASLWERLFKAKLFPVASGQEFSESEPQPKAEPVNASAGRSGG